MIQSKLAQILRSFTESEWRACYKYLKYACKSEAVSIRLFQYMFKNRKQNTTDHYSKDQLLKKVFPRKSVKFLLNAASDLSYDLESFLLHQRLQEKKQRFNRKLELAQIYKTKGLYNCFERTINELKKECASSPDLDLFYNYKKLQIHHLLYFSESYSKFVRPYHALLKAENELAAFSKNLNYFYKIEKEHTQELIEIETEKSIDHSPTNLHELLNHLYLINKDHNPESEAFVTNLLKNESTRLSDELAETILITLINECIYQTKRGSMIHRERMAELYLYGLNSGILLLNGRLSEKRFLNIIDVLSKSHLSITPAAFIDEWMPAVETPDPTSLENIAFALWQFATEDYRNALYNVEIAETKLTDLNLSVRARWIKVCALCSLYPEYQEKSEVLEAARLFFMRHKRKMTSQTFQASNNLLKIIRLIWNNQPASEVTDFLTNNPVIVQRHWIEQHLKKMAR